jgi:hypothetical protein
MTTGRINQVTLVKKESQKSSGRNDLLTRSSFFSSPLLSKDNSGSGSVICLIDSDNEI